VLWGDYYYDSKVRKFMPKASEQFNKRTFVEFILEPLYKLCVGVISKERTDLEPMLMSLGVTLKKSEYKMDTKPLLRLVLRKYYGNSSAVVDSVVEFVPNVRIGT
jgi:U5 small nuclear ribonucleoprotein component